MSIVLINYNGKASFQDRISILQSPLLSGSRIFITSKLQALDIV